MTPADSALEPLNLDALLAPIPGDRPAGADLRYEKIYDDIKVARRAADDKRQGKSAHSDADDTLSAEERASAASVSWLEVRQLATDVLTTQSKDLQIGVWLLEAETYLGGFAGASQTLELIGRLVDAFWDTMYPAVQQDDEPLAFRVGAMEWINEKLPGILKGLPLSAGSRKLSLADFELAEKATGPQARAELAASGRPSLDQFAQAMSSSSGPHLEAMDAQITACLTRLTQLEQAAAVRFVTQPQPEGAGRAQTLLSFSEVRKALEACQYQVGRALRTKGLRDAGKAGGPGGAAPNAVAAATGDAIWDHALQLVTQGQLEGLRIAQDYIDGASSGRERFLRQLQLSELCIQAGMHAFAYPILDELGKTIEQRDLVNWEDPDVIRRTWSGLAGVCKSLARLRPESVAREAEALKHLTDLGVNEGQTAVTDT